MQNNGRHRLARELDRGRLRELLLAVVLAGVVGLPLLLYVWQNTQWVRSGYEMDRLKSARERLAEQNHQLRLERTSLQSLARVENVVTEQLGLTQPPAGTVVLVDTMRLPNLAPHAAPGTYAQAHPLPPVKGSTSNASPPRPRR